MRNRSHIKGDLGLVGGVRKSFGYRDLSTRAIVWSGIVLVLLGIGTAVWLLLAYGRGTEADKARLEAIKTAGTIVVGTGGAAALWLAARRQQTSERVATQTEHDAAERRVTELYTKAVEQLGSDKAPVRLGGMYALERLAQNVPGQQQTIVNVLCAYLRMPYVPPSEGDADQGDDEGRHQERHARLTAQRILAAHLVPGDDPRHPVDTYWEGIDLDLTGATLLDLDFGECRIQAAQFVGARFCGRTSFRNAMFDGDVWFDETTFDGDASFSGAEFAAAAWFRGKVNFTQNAWFSGVRFGGTIGFNDATFSGDAWFRETKFDAAAAFDWVEFSAEAWFNGAGFSGSSAFTGTEFRRDAWFCLTKFGGEAVFDGARFGGPARFDGAEFGKYAGFNDARFEGEAWFDRASFGEGAWFRGTGFDAATTFELAVFGKAAWFDRTCFGGGACFRETEFRKAVAFESARIRLDVHLPEESIWPYGLAEVEPVDDEEARLPGRDGRWGHLRKLMANEPCE